MPNLTLDGNQGFLNLDSDGVYRAYAVNGTVISAARLTADEITIYVDARAPALSATDAETERAIFSTVDSSAVPDDELLNPPAAVQPTELLASVKSYVSPREVGPLEEAAKKRQVTYFCEYFGYCVGNPAACFVGIGCRCNGVFCS